MRDLGTLGGAQSQAMAINKAGSIVGVANDNSGQRRAFLWRPDIGMTELQIASARSARAMGIAADGTIVGVFEDVGGMERAFLASPE